MTRKVHAAARRYIARSAPRHCLRTGRHYNEAFACDRTIPQSRDNFPLLGARAAVLVSLTGFARDICRYPYRSFGLALAHR